jgi:hypothetical protein
MVGMKVHEVITMYKIQFLSCVSPNVLCYFMVINIACFCFLSGCAYAGCVLPWTLVQYGVSFLVWVCVCWMCTTLSAGTIWSFVSCLGVCMLGVYYPERWYNIEFRFLSGCVYAGCVLPWALVQYRVSFLVWVCVCWMCTTLSAGTIWTIWSNFKSFK